MYLAGFLCLKFKRFTIDVSADSQANNQSVTSCIRRQRCREMNPNRINQYLHLSREII